MVEGKSQSPSITASLAAAIQDSDDTVDKDQIARTSERSS
jgi:hypothetical protein